MTKKKQEKSKRNRNKKCNFWLSFLVSENIQKYNSIINITMIVLMLITIFATNSLTNKQIDEMKKTEFRRERSVLISLIRELEVNESQMSKLLIKEDGLFKTDSLYITSKYKISAFNRQNSMNLITSDSLITKLYEIYDNFELSNDFYDMRSYEQILPLTSKNLKKYEIGILELSKITIEDCKNMIRDLKIILLTENEE